MSEQPLPSPLDMQMNVPALLATYQLRQREFLLRITRAMTSRLDLPSLLTLILNSAAEIVGCRAGLIALERDPLVHLEYDVAGTRFQVRATYNIPPQYVPAFAPLLDVGPLVTYDQDGGVTHSVDPEAIFLDLQTRVQDVEERLGVPLGQVLGIPLLFEEELLGIIYLFRGEYAFTKMDWQLLQGFANQAAIAVRNARLYQQLETERSRLQTIVENSADGIMILDAAQRVLVINPALAAMLDVKPETTVGRFYHDVLTLDNVTGDDLAAADDLDVFFLDENPRCEGDLNRPGGRRLTLAVTYTPITNEDGALLNVVVNVYDITRFREEEEIKSTFTSIISHELKTPVALIKGYAQTLAREDADWDSETARQGLQVIEEEADRLEALINNLLDVSRIQASGLRLDFADVDIQTLAAKVAANFRTQTTSHRIELDFPAQLPLVWGDEERIRQVLNNLVSNAIKYSPEGGLIRIGGWYEAADQGHDNRVVLYVADEGIGIPSDELPHIFDRFYRVDSSLRRSTDGAGLGLFLCKAIAEAHGGEIWVRSEQDKGTTFFIALPVDADAAASTAARASGTTPPPAAT
ncbi:MAG: GAF domain-containing protein [Caldilineaceae bacterium]|nr:GAF domain-containing protein [Caldilineaceae bacterium]